MNKITLTILIGLVLIFVHVPYVEGQNKKVHIGTSTNDSFAVASLGFFESKYWFVSAYLNSEGNQIILALYEEDEVNDGLLPDSAPIRTRTIAILPNRNNFKILDLVSVSKGKVALVYIEDDRNIMGSMITASYRSLIPKPPFIIENPQKYLLFNSTTPELIRRTGGDNIYLLDAISLDDIGNESPSVNVEKKLVLNYHSSNSTAYSFRSGERAYLGAITCNTNVFTSNSTSSFSTLNSYSIVKSNGGDVNYDLNDCLIEVDPYLSPYTWADNTYSKIIKINSTSFMSLAYSTKKATTLRFDKWELDGSSSGVKLDKCNVTAHYNKGRDKSVNYGGAFVTWDSRYIFIQPFDLIKVGNTIYYTVVSSRLASGISTTSEFKFYMHDHKNFIFGKIELTPNGDIIDPFDAIPYRGVFPGTWVDANISNSKYITSPSLGWKSGNKLHLFFSAVTGGSNQNLEGKSGSLTLIPPNNSAMQDGPTNAFTEEGTMAGYANRPTHHQNEPSNFITIYKENMSSNRIIVAYSNLPDL